jgi:ABC-type transporter Mla subunit MlaD
MSPKAPRDRTLARLADVTEDLRDDLARLDEIHATLMDRQRELDARTTELTRAVQAVVRLGESDTSAAHPGVAQLLDAVRAMQETQMSFNLQYLQLQSQMQHENRSFTAISNIMKTKHDTVKNSIANIR